MNRHFTKVSTWMANKHINRYSTSSVTREIKPQGNTMTHLLLPISRAHILNRERNNQMLMRMWSNGNIHCWCKIVPPLGEACWRHLKKLKLDFFLHLSFFKEIFLNLFYLATCATCGILVLQPGIKPRTPALGAWSHNHWTAREVPITLSSIDIWAQWFSIRSLPCRLCDV